MKKAYIVFDGENKRYCGEGGYQLICDDEVIGTHYCSNRDFANHDLTIWRLEELEKNKVDEVISNDVIVWKKDDKQINDKTNDKFEMANVAYEAKNCR